MQLWFSKLSCCTLNGKLNFSGTVVYYFLSLMYSIIETSLNLLVQSNSSDSYSCDTAHQHKCLQYSNETCQEYSRCVGAQFYSWRCLSKNMSHVCWYCTRKNKNVRTVYLHVWDMDRSRTLPRGYDTVMKLMQTHTRAVRRKSSYGGWLQSR